MKKIFKNSLFVGLVLFALTPIAFAQSPISTEIDSADVSNSPQSVSSGQSRGQGRSGSVTLRDVNALNQIFDKYEQKKGVESILISSDLLSLSMGSNVNESTKELLSKLSGIRIINIKKSIREGNLDVSSAFVSEITSLLTSDSFKRVMRVMDGSERLEMFVTNREVNGALIFIANSKDAVSVIAISGDVDKRVIDAALSGEIKIK